MRLAVAVLLALIASVATAGCGWLLGDGLGKGAAVLVVGDSLLYQSYDQVDAALRADGWEPTIHPHPGATIHGMPGQFDWAPVIREHVATVDPDVAFVELGTNGCGDCPSLDAGIDAVMAPLDGVDQVYWLTPRIGTTLTRPVETLAALEAAADRWDNLHLVDGITPFADDPGLISEDRVHFTDDGEERFAQVVAAALPDLE